MDVLLIVRDIAVIVLAIESILVGIAALVLILTLWKLANVLRGHVDRLVGLTSEVLGTTAETARNVRGTTSFVADHTARPLIEVVSIVTAAAKFAKAAFSSDRGDGKDRG